MEKKSNWKSRVTWFVLISLMIGLIAFASSVTLIVWAGNENAKLLRELGTESTFFTAVAAKVPLGEIFTFLTWIVGAAIAGFRGRDIAVAMNSGVDSSVTTPLLESKATENNMPMEPVDGV